MAAGFRTRKIKTETSIGDRLKRARIRRKVSISEVEESTKIRSRFILALESDSWEQIPSETHGRGYLEAYVQFLKLPIEPIMKQFRRERDLYARKCKEANVELIPKGHLRIPRFLLTPRFFTIALGSLVVLGAAGMVTSQIKAFSSSPFIEMDTPQEVSVVASTFEVKGHTAIGVSLEVNGDPVKVGKNGEFSDKVDLQKGTNAVVVEAVNSQGKKTTETISVIAK